MLGRENDRSEEISQRKGESLALMFINTNMKILPVREYNRLDLIKYEKRWDEWAGKGGYNSNQLHPQQAFYCFYSQSGQFRKTGYVAFDDNRAIWRKTKKEAIAAFMKRGDNHGR